MLAALFIAAAVGSEAREDFLRRRVAEVALQQIEKPDPRWIESQRDCAGLVRFAFRSAFQLLDPGRLALPLWEDDAGRPADFADARALVGRSFKNLGRDLPRLRSGDLLAFRQGDDDFHLMIAVVPPDGALSGALVVYHPGSPGAQVRAGTLRALSTEAPREWRPVAENPAFLGFLRFKEWAR